MPRDYILRPAVQGPGRESGKARLARLERIVEANADRHPRLLRPGPGRLPAAVEKGLRRGKRRLREEVRRTYRVLVELADRQHGLVLATRQVVAERLARRWRTWTPSVTAVSRSLAALEEVGALVRLEAPVRGGRMRYCLALQARELADRRRGRWVAWSAEVGAILDGRQAELAEPLELHWPGGTTSTLRMRLRRRSLRCDTYGSEQVSHLTTEETTSPGSSDSGLRPAMSQSTSTVEPGDAALVSKAPTALDSTHEARSADMSDRRSESGSETSTPAAGGFSLASQADRPATTSSPTPDRLSAENPLAYAYRRAGPAIAALEAGTGEPFDRARRRRMAEEVLAAWPTTASAVWACRVAAWRARRRMERGELHKRGPMGYAIRVLEHHVERQREDYPPDAQMLSIEERAAWRAELEDLGLWDRYVYDIGLPLEAGAMSA